MLIIDANQNSFSLQMYNKNCKMLVKAIFCNFAVI
jgi:hypothetical protein